MKFKVLATPFVHMMYSCFGCKLTNYYVLFYFSMSRYMYEFTINRGRNNYLIFYSVDERRVKGEKIISR